MTFPAAILLLAGSLRALPPKLPEFKPLDFKPPQGARVALANGMILYLLEDHELPVIQGSALVRTGTIRDPSGKTGLAALVGRTMRSAGSKRFPADAMNETLESLGASVETGMGQESGSAGFWCLAKDLDQVLEIFADVLMHPAFETEKVEVERQKMLEEVRRRNDDPRQIARREAPRMLYGPDHPYGRRTEEATIKAVSIGDLRAFHERFLVPGGVSLALSGDFRSAELGEKVREAFQAWPARAPEPPAFPEVAAVNERRVFLVPKEVTQAAIRVVQFGFPRHHPDHFAFEVMNDILGGNAFISRLFTEVRSRKGLAYSVGSFFTEPSVAGMIGAGVGTKNETAFQATEEVLGQASRMRAEPVKPEEFSLAVETLTQSFVFNYETPSQIIQQRMSLDFFGFPPGYLDTYLDKVRSVTPADVQRVAKAWLDPDRMIVFVVGDPGKFDKALDGLGPVVRREAD